MKLDLLHRVFREYADSDAITAGNEVFSYAWLADGIDAWRRRLLAGEVDPGTVVLLEADFSPAAVALLLALLERDCIVVPTTGASAAEREQRARVAQAELSLRPGDDGRLEVTRLSFRADHTLYGALRAAASPGLVLFSSGSSGVMKAAVHDVMRLLKKFATPRPRLRTVGFLLFDHIGGVNTLFHVLSNGGCLITVTARTPDDVLGAVARHRAEVLPATPTFLTIALLGEAFERHDLSSLRVITYGTEPMPAATLRRLHAILPNVRLQQTYGLSEIGILRSKSRANDSLWVKVGGEGFATRIVDGRLEIKADSAMLGYLNAPTPFAEDGWFRTGDLVEQDGEYVRFCGRVSDVINVGGQKVHPLEVEDVIRELSNVAEVTAYGRENPIVGQVVGVRVQLKSCEDAAAFRSRLRRHCRKRLAEYKVPVYIECVDGIGSTPRFKKSR